MSTDQLHRPTDPITLTVVGFRWVSDAEGSRDEVMLAEGLVLGPGGQLVVARPGLRLDPAPDRTVLHLESRFVGAFPERQLPRLTLVVTCDRIHGEDIVLAGLPTSQPEVWKLSLNGRMVNDSSWVRVKTGDRVLVLTWQHHEQGLTPLLGVEVGSAGAGPDYTEDIPTAIAPRVEARRDLLKRFCDQLFPADPNAWDRNAIILAAFCSDPSDPLKAATTALAACGMSTKNLSHTGRFVAYLRRTLADCRDPHVETQEATLEDVLRISAFPLREDDARALLIDRLRKAGLVTPRARGVIAKLTAAGS
ncbi:hypothetical protein GCM10010988_17320 [Cnuibacter physcomitrellae]|uniref:Uncharacterized protein n=1 Tax=Cnuibacter physcomitrellae TaxID=1619308 RepID=A0A1X9LMZ5_9MICO|nr:hypothetical protein [Cnuibacter physcomitrellae]ARJ06477.1 hypothetical protein B5808_15580 [Cnuibacter physcomitrellae]GGI38106.1 hypothetical protein GCM10010988_17320 [Cnuibacter physcomitrellae]